MRGTQRVAAHLLQLAHTVVLHCVRDRSTHAGVVLVIACSLQLHDSAVEKKSLLGIEGHSTNSERGFVAVDDSGFRLHFRHQLVSIPRFERPEEWLSYVDLLLVCLLLPSANC